MKAHVDKKQLYTIIIVCGDFNERSIARDTLVSCAAKPDTPMWKYCNTMYKMQEWTVYVRTVQFKIEPSIFDEL